MYNASCNKEGTALLKVVLDISAPNGTAEAHDQMALSQAKAVMIIRPENSVSPVNDDGTPLPGFTELDSYNSDGTTGIGHSRFSNDIYLGSFPPTQIAGNDFGDEISNSLLLGFPWPAFNDIDYGLLSKCRRDWSWDSNSGQSDSGSNMSGFFFSTSIPAFITARPHVD